MPQLAGLLLPITCLYRYRSHWTASCNPLMGGTRSSELSIQHNPPRARCGSSLTPEAIGARESETSIPYGSPATIQSSHYPWITLRTAQPAMAVGEKPRTLKRGVVLRQQDRLPHPVILLPLPHTVDSSESGLPGSSARQKILNFATIRQFNGFATPFRWSLALRGVIPQRRQGHIRSRSAGGMLIIHL
jgi:hypothetical protein